MKKKVIRLQVKLEREIKMEYRWAYYVYSDCDDGTTSRATFLTEEEAYKHLEELHKQYPDAFLVPKNEVY